MKVAALYVETNGVYYGFFLGVGLASLAWLVLVWAVFYR